MKGNNKKEVHGTRATKGLIAIAVAAVIVVIIIIVTVLVFVVDIGEKLVADQHPELWWKMAHAAAACGKGKKQHFERVVAIEKKGFDGWQAFIHGACRWEDHRL
jgi:hypothetical protein